MTDWKLDFSEDVLMRHVILKILTEVIRAIIAVSRLAMIVALLACFVGSFIWVASQVFEMSFSQAITNVLEYQGVALAGFVVLISAGVALDTLGQKSRNDDREMFASRVKWAVELTSKESERQQELGWSILDAYTSDPRRVSSDLFYEGVDDYLKSRVPSLEVVDSHQIFK